MNTPGERTVAGLRCGEVLELLSDFIDAEVSAAKRQNVVEHLRGCDWCEKFSARFGDIVAALRRELGEAPAVRPDVASRLRESLAKAMKK